jgi:hypothetical protein
LRPIADGISEQRIAQQTKRSMIAKSRQSSAACLPGLFDELSKAVQLFVCKLSTFASQQRRKHFFGGSLKKRFDHVAQSGLPHGVARNGWKVHVSQALFFMPDVPLIFQNPKLRTDR